jgi:succinoglycan biosynthesis transport protein ExoP
MKPDIVPLTYTADDDKAESPPNIVGLLHAFLRRFWIIGLGAVAGGLIAGAYVKRISEKYVSKTVIQIESQPNRPTAMEEVSTDNLRDPIVMETVIQNFNNRYLMERVGRELNLRVDPDFLGGAGPPPASEEQVINLLLSSVEIAPRPKTLLVDISFTHSNPKVAQRLTAAIVEQFLQQNTEQQIDQMGAQNAMLGQKAAELKAKVERSELAVQDYKNRMESVSVDAGRNLVEEKLRGLSASLTASRNVRIRIESDLNIIRSVANRDPAKLFAIASVAMDPQVVAARTRVEELEAERLALADQFRDKHPRMIEARNRIEDAQAVKLEAILGAPARIEALYDSSLAAEKSLEKAVAEQEKELLKLDEKIAPYRRLQQELEADRSLYASVQKRLKETAMLIDVKPVDFRMVQPATSATPLPNRRKFIILGAIVAGASLGAAIIAGIFFLDSSIKSVDDAERLLGLPVLSAIPTFGKVRSATQALALLERPDSPMAESFRSLRTALSLLGPGESRKVILFTSAVPSEGKTINAVNTAISFAQQGLRTVIIDADLRRPTVSLLLLKMHGKCAGVTEYMEGAEVALHPTEIVNLSILPAGGPALNPAELLSGGRFEELVEQLKGQFDRIIIDTAPINIVSDTLNIVAAAQTIVLVVRNGRTPHRLVQRALELLARAHAHPDGLSLNFMPRWAGIANHYYYSRNSKYGGRETYGGESRTSKPTIPHLSPRAKAAPVHPLSPSAN